MTEIKRIEVGEARTRMAAGGALLVCAYEDPAKYMSMNLEGSISIQRLRELRPSLPRDTEVIFYCA